MGRHSPCIRLHMWRQTFGSTAAALDHRCHLVCSGVSKRLLSPERAVSIYTKDASTALQAQRQKEKAKNYPQCASGTAVTGGECSVLSARRLRLGPSEWGGGAIEWEGRQARVWEAGWVVDAEKSVRNGRKQQCCVVCMKRCVK